MATLSAAHRHLLLSRARLHDIAAGARILQRDQFHDSTYVLLSGRAVAGSSAGASYHSLAILHPGDIFGVSVTLGRGRRVTGVVAREDCTALELPNALLDQLRRDPQLDGQLHALLTEHMAHTHAIDHPRAAAVNHHVRAGLRLHRHGASPKHAVAPDRAASSRAPVIMRVLWKPSIALGLTAAGCAGDESVARGTRAYGEGCRGCP